MATPLPLFSLKQPPSSILFLHHSRFNSPSFPPLLPTNHRHSTHTPRLLAFSKGRTPSNETGCPVPFDQQPINEYQSLSTSFPFSWATAEPVEYGSRLFATGLAFAVFVGLPVSWVGSIGSGGHDPVRLALGSVSGGILVVTLAVLRMYLGWAYVGNRLLSATVEYEETGWYDGQIWVKSAEVLARDRLLGSFQVKPVLTRLKNTLVILAASLLFLVPYLFYYESSEGSVQRSSEVRAIAGVYSEDSARSFEPDAFCGEPGSS